MIEVETTEDIEHKDHQAEPSIVKTASSEQSEISGKKSLNQNWHRNFLYAKPGTLFHNPKNGT